MQFKRHLAAAFLTIAALSAPGVAQAQTSDQILADRVASAVHKYLRLTMFDDITISVKDRNVTLSGRVTQPMKKDELGQRVAKVDGVRTFVNDIGVLPASLSDDRLRRDLANRIYGNPTFQRYSEMREPPIHIIVENGRVTLTGYVNDAGEKALASALAQVNGVFAVKNELRIDKS